MLLQKHKVNTFEFLFVLFQIYPILYKLIHYYYDIDAWEMYDLKKDPHELNNVYDEPAYAGTLRKLKLELQRLREKYGDSDELTKQLLAEDLERQELRKKYGDSSELSEKLLEEAMNKHRWKRMQSEKQRRQKELQRNN